MKRASLAKEESGLNLVLTIPPGKRSPGQEHLIQDRLRDHFKRHRRLLQEQIKKERISGLKMAGLGVAFMFIATYLLTYTVKNIWTTFIVVLPEPAGWFTFWEGLDQVLFRAKEITPDLAFYRRMTGAKIHFTPKPEAPPKPGA